MDAVKVGLVGAGGIGNYHAKIYESIEGKVLYA